MLLSDDESGEVEHHSVDGGLSSQPAEAVTIGLDLVPVDRAVHDGDIDSNSPATETQFLKERHARLLAMAFLKTVQQYCSNVSVAGRLTLEGGRRFHEETWAIIALSRRSAVRLVFMAFNRTLTTNGVNFVFRP